MARRKSPGNKDQIIEGLTARIEELEEQVTSLLDELNGTRDATSEAFSVDGRSYSPYLSTEDSEQY